jgi:hypothetical protein
LRAKETALTINVLHGIPRPTTYSILRKRIHVPADLSSACLSAALGLALTGLGFALGFGVEIGKALGAAG